MQFNSYAFILAFFPLTAGGYFLLCRGRFAGHAQHWMLLASLLFYSVWSPVYLPLMLGSIGFNFLLSRGIDARGEQAAAAKRLLSVGVACNLLLLGYFKYADFFIENLNLAAGSRLPLPHIILPLGISFFTFTQIAFLVDTWQRRASRPGFVNYALFVSYFPHLLSGPILHHGEMMPQFENAQNRLLNFDNLARGLFLFGLGLAKKVVLADSLADIADAGFKQPGAWSFADAWLIALAYSLQLYFDFSGYTDMAVGMSRMLNIRLPVNFDSPYRATSIRDFWRRWHITLSRFLRQYLYVPLGGNRSGGIATARNLFVTFLLGGLWHGAGWTFIVWGALHGAAMVVQRFWSAVAKPMPQWLAWFVTFVFVNVAWVFFRAASIGDALALLSGMAGGRGFVGTTTAIAPCLLIGICFGLAICGANSNALAEQPLTRRNAVLAVLALAAGLLSLSQTSPFIYFNF
jgi:D-alanyl-lipoteichoic acid acyltransferase DltB (MBOAT superfamily)